MFHCTNRAFVPPCNLATIKVRAALALAGYWKEHGRAPLALALLRAADALRRSGTDFSRDALATIYREHGATLSAVPPAA